MEQFLQTDLTSVRVHVGPQAPSIGALAFTNGSNLYFAPGQYQPHTSRGLYLLGHELAHVVQQRQGRVIGIPGSDLSVVRDRTLDAEANRIALQAARYKTAGRSINAGPRSAQAAANSWKLPDRHQMSGQRPGWVAQAMLANNLATEPSQGTYLTATLLTSDGGNVEVCNNLQSSGGRHSEDRFIDEILPNLADQGTLQGPPSVNTFFIGINRSPCTSTDHCGNGQPSSDKPNNGPGCAERLIALVTNGFKRGSKTYKIKLYISTRGIYGSNDSKKANSIRANEAMQQAGIDIDLQRMGGTSTKFMGTGAMKKF
jgi:hypothetical protein